MACWSLVLAADLDLARLGLLGDRDLQGQHAGVVAGLDVFGVQVVSEDQLPAEHPPRTFGCDELRVGCPWRALGLHRDHVAFHVDVDRVRADPRQVELDVEGVALTPGVHRHGRGAGHRPGGAEHLLGQSVKVTERVGAHQHRLHLHRVRLMLLAATTVWLNLWCSL